MKKSCKYDTNLKILVNLENKRIINFNQSIDILISDIDLQLNNLIEKLNLLNYFDIFDTIDLNTNLDFIRKIYIFSDTKSHKFVFSNYSDFLDTISLSEKIKTFVSKKNTYISVNPLGLIKELKEIDNNLENLLSDYFLNKFKEVKNSFESIK